MASRSDIRLVRAHLISLSALLLAALLAIIGFGGAASVAAMVVLGATTSVLGVLCMRTPEIEAYHPVGVGLGVVAIVLGLVALLA